MENNSIIKSYPINITDGKGNIKSFEYVTSQDKTLLDVFKDVYNYLIIIY